MYLSMRGGEIPGVVGESGAGKSVTGAAIVGLIEHPGRITCGEIRPKGDRIDHLPAAGMRRSGQADWHGVPGPPSSLNPLFRIGDQIVETMRAHLESRAEACRAPWNC
jgi:peptide/nickel transport system ATP-binding protein